MFGTLVKQNKIDPKYSGFRALLTKVVAEPFRPGRTTASSHRTPVHELNVSLCRCRLQPTRRPNRHADVPEVIIRQSAWISVTIIACPG